ncbi:hypothetical protein MPER_01592 [Moniliophthora perniciosa FA553]|nr:hypothetical protein MPER_01592 [Moniliophthora perniciosa FA553]
MSNPVKKSASWEERDLGNLLLALSLLRMIEPLSGKIYQDVSLFSGTLRTNLDPLGDNSDEEVIEIMRRCHLSSVLNHKGDVDERTLLDLPIGQGSLSGGERQLVPLARAVLRKSATSS